MMTAHRIRRIFLGGLVALLCAQILYGTLMLSALYKQYEEPVVQINALLCRDISDHLGLLVRVGKSLRPQTVEKFLDPYRMRTKAANIAVAAPDGTVLHQLDKKGPPKLAVPSGSSSLPGNVCKFSDNDNIWTVADVLDRHGAVAGRVFLALDKTHLFSFVFKAAGSQLWLFLCLTLAECLLLLALLRYFARSHHKNPDTAPTDDKKTAFHLRLCFMLPLIAGQVLFLFLLYSPLKTLYQTELISTGRQIAAQLTWDLERLVGLGLPVRHINSMESWLMARQKHIDSLAMAVFDADGTLKCATNARQTLDESQWEAASSAGELAGRYVFDPNSGELAGRVEIAMDPSASAANLRSVMLDDLTVTIVASLFLAELLYLLLMSGCGLKAMTASPGFMRPIIFGCLFATEMSMSYVPIRIGELGLDLFGLPPDVVSGLPVSSELLMAGAAMFIGGFWSQRSGWRPMLIAGLLLAFAGSMLSWLSTGPLPFILSRGLSGLGYGFINLSAQVFVIAHSSEDSRARNLAFMFAGLYAGTLCGSAMGGLIADRLGYHAVFPASAMLLLASALLLTRLLPREPWLSESGIREKLTMRQTAAFLGDRRMGSLLAFFIIPNALITVCLFQFFVPLSLSQAGTSPASIGRVFLVYCVIVMFAGPVFGSLLDRSKKMERPLFLSLIIAACSIVSLIFADGVTGAMLCVGLLAVNTAIASNGQGAYALSLPAAIRFGRSRTMGFYNVAMRFGQVLGPLSLGIMIAMWDVKTGLTVLAAFTLLSAVFFLLLSWRPADGNEEKH